MHRARVSVGVVLLVKSLMAGLLFPVLSFAQSCGVDQAYVASASKCATVINKYRTNKADALCTRSGICQKTGGYLLPASLGITIGGRILTATYDSTRPAVAAAAGVSTNNFGEAPGFGPLWLSNFHRRIVFKAGGQQATVYRGGGLINSFQLVGGVFTSDPDVIDTLKVFGSGFLYTNTATQTEEVYNATGQLASLQSSNGSVINFTYSTAGGANAPAAGYLLSATDNTGRTISFSYTLSSGGNGATDGHVTSITDPAGQVTTLSYTTAGLLSKITYPDGTTNQFLYEITNAAWALTGVVDEMGLIRSTINYDANGVAYASSGVGGAGASSTSYGTDPAPGLTQSYDSTNNILYNTYGWSSPSSISRTSASGAVTNRTYTNILGVPFVTSSAIPSGVGGSTATTNYIYDANGNAIEVDDPQGMRSCMSYDSQNRMLVSITGLTQNAVCATVLSQTGSALPAGAKRVANTWHPDWRLPLTITRPGSITTYVYQGQLDPFTSTTANCSAVPAMPSGKPSPVVCKTVTQATNVATGVLDASVPNVVSTYTYDMNGNVLSSTDSKGNSTSYAYYTATSFASGAPDAQGQTVGDLKTVTNVLGQITTYTQYDRVGRLRQSVDLHNVVTDTVYSPRGFVQSVTVTPPGMAARKTSYTYDKTGLKLSSTAPDGTVTTFYKDRANKTFGVIDVLGNESRVVSDNSGNAIQKIVLDSTGKKVNQVQNAYDLLNRLQMTQIIAPDVYGLPLLKSSANPATAGSAVTFNIAVPGVSPTGTVTINSDGIAIGSAALSAGSASFSTTALTAGSHTITASYSGDPNNAAKASDAMTQTITNAANGSTARCGNYVCVLP